VTAINTGLGVLLSVCVFHSSISAYCRDIYAYQAIKGATDSYDSLVDLLESIEIFLARLEIYIKITPTIGMTEMVVRILVELLSTLALVTKQINQGNSSESVLREMLCCFTQYNVEKLAKKLFGGENDVKAVLQRLDRLTQEEARVTAAQTLEVVYGLTQNMRVVLDGEKSTLGSSHAGC
jgi:hypothetical protein